MISPRLRPTGWQWWVVFWCGLVLAPTLLQRTGRTDLEILLDAATRLKSHESVYRLQDANEHTKPPPVTVLMLPLTYLPRALVLRLWDVLNLCAFPALVLLVLRHSVSDNQVSRFLYFLLFFLLTPWNSELRLGQYNVLLLLPLTAASLYKRSLLSGAAFAIAVLFKPTFLLLGPWVLCHSKERFKTVLSGAVTAVALFLLYAAVVGFDRLIPDTMEWVHFLPLSSAKHLLRLDNHGLPSLLGGGANLLLATGLVLSLWSSWFSAWLMGLSIAVVLSIICSPMAWLQNYVLLIPAVVWALRRQRSTYGAIQRVYEAALFILWIGIGFINPTTCRLLGCEAWGWPRPPLTGLLVACILVAISEKCLRANPERWARNGF